MYNNKNKFLSFLKDQNLDVFSLSQLTSFFGKTMAKADYEFIENLARQGVLTQLRSSLYAVNPHTVVGLIHLPNWHKVAVALVHPKDHYIGYYSALQIHELVTQPALREYIVVKEQFYPKVRNIAGIPFEVISTKENRFFGFRKHWINDHDKVYCSDIEKTIIDCIYKPQYAGGLEGIIKAIDKAKNKIKPSLLVEYAIQLKVQAVLKRLGYILESMGLYPTEQNILNQLISEAYTKLDPSLKIKGRFNRKWRIEDNVDLEDILQTTNT